MSRFRPPEFRWSVVLFLGCLAAGAAEHPKHLVSLDDLATLRSAEDLRLSPNGDSLAYVTGDGDLWTVGTRPGSIPESLGKGVLPRWSPDGKHLAYYAGESRQFQLWIRDMDSAVAEQVTSTEGGINPDPYTRLSGWTRDPLVYSWSPDGSRLVFASRVEWKGIRSPSTAEPDSQTPASGIRGTPLVLTSTTPPEWTLSGIFQAGGFGVPKFVNGAIEWSTHATSTAFPLVSQLFTVDVRTKITTQLTNDDGIYFNPDWSPDGRTIVCALSEGRSLLGNGSGTTNIYAVDVATGKKTALTHGSGDKRLPAWSADGNWIAYLGGKHFDIQSVFAISGLGGTPRNVTDALKRNVLSFQWNVGSKSIVVVYQDGVSWPIARIDLQTRRSHMIVSAEPATRTYLHVSPSGAFTWQQSDSSAGGVLCVMHREGDAPILLVGLNPQIKNWELGQQEVVRWKNSRGEAKEGILLKPVGYKRGRRYPLIVDAYPGQPNSFKGYAMTGNQTWASRGYAVFWPEARAPHTWINPFKSRAFDLAGKGPSGLYVMVDDVLSGVRTLVQRGIVDPQRMGLYGFSNGGGIVNQLVTRTSVFKCAVSVAAATSVDWSDAFFLHTMNPMLPIMVGSLPWQDPDAYIRLSVIYHLDRIRTPILLADGDNDGDFLLNSIKMYNGLRFLGKNVVFLRYPDQGHEFEGAAITDFWQRASSFFDRHLKDDSH